jgi:hypothetical protein
MKRFLTAIVLLAAPAYGQSVDIGTDHAGLSIGNSPRWTGIRLNFRDSGLERVQGVNVTVWKPAKPVTGAVQGISIGILMTGAQTMQGAGIGLLGLAADSQATGVFAGGLGFGSGGELRGVSIGGLGVGAGGSIQGFSLGGLGIGAGGDIKGVSLAGLGVGAGASLVGLSVGLLGVGAGGDIHGVVAGGLGVGAGGSITGISVGLLGVGAGESISGVVLAGLGAGSPRLRGLAMAIGAVGSTDFEGVALVPGYLRIEAEGRFSGVSVSAFNHVLGMQNGLTIGIFNYARELHGLQIGLLNFAGNNRRGLRWLPFANAHFD